MALRDLEVESQVLGRNQLDEPVAGIDPFARLRDPPADHAGKRRAHRVPPDDGFPLPPHGDGCVEGRFGPGDFRPQRFDLRFRNRARRTDALCLGEPASGIVQRGARFGRLRRRALVRQLFELPVQRDDDVALADPVPGVDVHGLDQARDGR